MCKDAYGWVATKMYISTLTSPQRLLLSGARSPAPLSPRSCFSHQAFPFSRLRRYPTPLKIPDHCTSTKPIKRLLLFRKTHQLPPLRPRSLTPHSVSPRAISPVSLGTGKPQWPRPPAISPCRTIEEGTSPMSPNHRSSLESPYFPMSKASLPI